MQFSWTKVHVIVLYYTIFLYVMEFEVFKAISSYSEFGLLEHGIM